MSKSKTVYLKDYQPPIFLVDTIELDIDLRDGCTTVVSKARYYLTPANQVKAPLQLMGEKLNLKYIKLDQNVLSENDYQLDNDTLTIKEPPAEAFELEIAVEITPENNTTLNGLYRSGSMYCTQCEAQGFRRITYYLDRPDVMAKFTTTIRADKLQFPVLLSNGNCVAKGDCGPNRHFATWEDPFKKPSYLFAMVAGDLIAVEDHFLTQSGRLVVLKIFVEHENLDQTGHAMAALKKAMAWDEKAFGREYDLDIYMIVAVNDFNMGAMENKGLNIFNSKYVLAKKETATDKDFGAIDDVIAHEYLHNWSGNRVTCRDWFQLSLKEGFTVFREQLFSVDNSKSPVARIDNVQLLRSHQFVEDSGPMSHPVRPEAYMEINNFYTLTVYEKGAEVIRMMRTLVGEKFFRQGCDLYFERHDGQAVTIDDFVQAISDAAGVDLTQFKLWYSQAGTPVVSIKSDYDETLQTYTVHLSQTCPDTPGQSNKKPMHIPFAMGLLDKEGQDLPLCLDGKDLGTSCVLSFTKEKMSYTFTEVKEKPVASFLRGFSACVNVNNPQSEAELLFLLQHDSDDFNRWNVGQELFKRTLVRLIDSPKEVISTDFLTGLEKVLSNPVIHSSLKAEILSLPSATEIVESLSETDTDALFIAKKYLMQAIAEALEQSFLTTYQALTGIERYCYEPSQVAKRRLKNICLYYLMYLAKPQYIDLAVDQYNKADNMTDKMAVLVRLTHLDIPQRQLILDDFYQTWRHDPLVVNKWLSVQAQSELPSVHQLMKDLLQHEAFDIKNPNKVYALVGGFCSGNLIRFHEKTGEGYQFLTNQLEVLNAMNPQVAARMVQPLTQWRKYDKHRQKLMKERLAQLRQLDGITTDLEEIITKALA